MTRLLACLLAAGMVMPAVPAFAHAFLARATPPVGGTVTASPKELDLVFTEGVSAHFSTVQLLGPDGKPVKTGAPHTGKQQKELLVTLPALSPGKYTVVWHATSEDTHKTEGRFSFTISPR